MILPAISVELNRRADDGFEGRHGEAVRIVEAVCWHLCAPLIDRDIEEHVLKNGVAVDHSP